MDAYGTNLGEHFSANALMKFFETTVHDRITNADYEGQIKGGGADRVSILTFGNVTIHDYSGANLVVEDISESEGQLLVNQKKAYYFRIKSLERFESYVKNPESAMIVRSGKQLSEIIDGYVLGLYADVGSGNRVGTDYTTGTVTVTVTTGAVAGSGTTFTSGMEGLGFKATGHTSWYRIKTFTNTTTIVIEDDADDLTSAYNGGAISGGATYTIEAASVRTVTISNIYEYIDELAEKLDTAKIPKSDRWLVVNAKIAHILKRSEELTPAVASAYEDVVKKGLLGTVSGFMVYQNEQVSGNNTTGYYILAGHKSAITFALAFTESEIEPLIGNFGKAYKGLVVYGGKILDERRKALTYFWCKK